MEPKSQRRALSLLHFIIVALASFPIAVFSQLKPAHIFSDHMVMQRDREVPVWGTAKPGGKVVIFFNGSDYSTIAGKDGSWEIRLPAMPAGGPFEMSISGESATLNYIDIMIGDVWLCSGQSNMEWIVENSNDAGEEIKNGNHPDIRHFKVPLSSAPRPESELAGGEWQVATPETVGKFTAVGYFFAKNIVADIHVPIGLLNSSWGGSRIEPWIRAEDLGYADPEAMAAEIEAKKKSEQEAIIARLKEKLPLIPENDPGMEGGKAVWASLGLDENSWDTMELPVMWENAGWQDTDGIFWFRKTITLGKGMEVHNATLSLGPIDDSDQTWFNGHPVGSMEQAYNKERVYEIPAKYMKEGSNVITIRVEDTGGGGGVYGAPALMFLETGQKKIPLNGKWKYKVGMVSLKGASQNDNQQPTLLYNKMIYPLLKFPIKGVLWYQGESNAGNKEDAANYAEQFKSLITSWRDLWQIGAFPFLYVQLANFMAVSKEPAPSNWALLRESQGKALELANTGEAVIIDIGEAADIHPKNKQEVGRRLALAARHIAYGKEMVFSGPVFKQMHKEDAKIVLEFDQVGSGLVTKNGEPLKGFSVAGEDGNFVWADATISGNKIAVSAQEVTDPVAVRYAWADNPEDANLYNKEGLPASPFRTDTWVE